MDGNLVEQLFGFVGFGLLVSSWQFAAHRTILLFNVAAFVFFAIGLYLMGATVGALMIGFAAVNATVAVFTRNRWIVAVLLVVPVGVGFADAERIHDALPIISHVTGTIAFFSKDVRVMRKWAPVGTVLWAIYNFIVGAWGQFLADLAILASMALGAYRYRRA